MLQRQIDPRGQKTRRKNQQHNLNIERHVIPRVVIHHDASHVAHAFGQAAERHGDHVCPCFVADTQEDVDEHEEPEEAGEEGIRGERGVVPVDCGFDGAGGVYEFAAAGEDGGAGDCAAHCRLTGKIRS